MIRVNTEKDSNICNNHAACKNSSHNFTPHRIKITWVNRPNKKSCQQYLSTRELQRSPLAVAVGSDKNNSVNSVDFVPSFC